jgi:hypothetical protein
MFDVLAHPIDGQPATPNVEGRSLRPGFDRLGPNGI